MQLFFPIQVMSYLLALDQGTTSSRSIIFDQQGQVVASAQLPLQLSTPQAGWVEQDATEIWSSQQQTIQQVLQKARIQPYEIRAIGIANQRETTIVWNRKTGQAIAPAIVWQDRRTASFCQQLKDKGHETHIQNITGLMIDPYFSASKLSWILDNIPHARTLAQANELAFGTVDSWLIWNLSGGFHATDVSNASRTMLMDIHTQQWSQPLLSLFKIPASLLPKLVASGQEIASTSPSIFGAKVPIFSAIGDQQAALFGHNCNQAGMAKNTYGTGCFMLMNTGEHIIKSSHKLLSTVAWCRKDQQTTQFALEGSVFMAGAIVQWLRDNLGIIKKSHEIEPLASQVKDNGGVVLVPAFTGLGAPYWEPNALASINGLSRGTQKAHIARAALESIAFQVADVLHAMQQDAPIPLTELRVDGGASTNNLLMQFQADILGVPVLRPTQTETTALGAIKLAGISCGFFKETDLDSLWQLDHCFEPRMNEDERKTRLDQWKKAITKVLS